MISSCWTEPDVQKTRTSPDGGIKSPKAYKVQRLTGLLLANVCVVVHLVSKRRTQTWRDFCLRRVVMERPPKVTKKFVNSVDLTVQTKELVSMWLVLFTLSKKKSDMLASQLTSPLIPFKMLPWNVLSRTCLWELNEASKQRTCIEVYFVTELLDESFQP